MTHSTDYHDYVFRDGKLVGEFEAMYQHSATVPWQQDFHNAQWYGRVGHLLLQARATYQSILEVGCGVGSYLNGLRDLAAPDAVLEGFDVSQTAIDRARSQYDGLTFYVDDIQRADFRPRRTYDLVVVKEVLWYVLAHLDTVLANLRQCVRRGGSLYIGLAFPKLETAFIGKEIIQNPEALRSLVADYEPVAMLTIQQYAEAFSRDGPNVHLLVRKP